MVAIFHADSGTVNIPSAGHRTPEIRRIPEWLIWSVLNIFLGWVVGGIIALIFTIFCRYNKRMNNLSRAQMTSTLALISNIIATVSGIAGWVVLITLLIQSRHTYSTRYAK